MATNITSDRPDCFLKEGTAPIKVSVSDNRGGAGGYVWPANMVTIEERPVDQYKDCSVAELMRTKRGFLGEAAIAVKQKLELNALEKAKASTLWNQV